MQDATEHLRRLARRIVDAALERGRLRAAILLGQAAAATPTSIRTLTCFYVDELPPEEVLPEIRLATATQWISASAAVVVAFAAAVALVTLRASCGVARVALPPKRDIRGLRTPAEGA